MYFRLEFLVYNDYLAHSGILLCSTAKVPVARKERFKGDV